MFAVDSLLDGITLVSTEFLVVLIKVVVIFVVGLVGTMLMVWFERKVISYMQNRVGPNKAGPKGLLQTLADGIKLFFKEDLIPDKSDRFVFKLAPYLAFVPAFLVWSVIPLGGDFSNGKDGTVSILGQTTKLQLADPPVGVLLLLALSSVAVYGIMLAGWSSNNNYSLMGALRSSAQMISYELPQGLFLVSMLVLAGSFSLVQLVDVGRPWWEWIWVWLAFPLFFITVLAHTNRSPFDLPETENELVAGFQTEYGGMKFALFFMGEYTNMITMSAVVATLFFGGWRLPFGLFEDVIWLGPFVLGAKIVLLLFLFVWVRASISRPRYDQLMAFSWKTLLPISLGYMIVSALLTVFLK